MKGIIPNDLIKYRREDFDKLPYYILETLDKGQDIYYLNFFDEKMGYCTLTKIKDYEKCCNYITKYITKDCIKNEKGTIYISSRGLRKASNIHVPDVSPITGFDYENEFIFLKDYNLNNLSSSQSLDIVGSQTLIKLYNNYDFVTLLPRTIYRNNLYIIYNILKTLSSLLYQYLYYIYVTKILQNVKTLKYLHF